MSALNLAQIGQINVPVLDLDRAIAFYRDILGLPFLFSVPNLAFFDCAGVRLLLDKPEDPAFAHPSSIIYFRVEDIRGQTTALHVQGVEVINEPELIAKMPDHDLWLSFFKDPEGNTLALMEEVR